MTMISKTHPRKYAEAALEVSDRLIMPCEVEGKLIDRRSLNQTRSSTAHNK